MLLLAAWLAWEVRDVVPSWMAASVIATVELATTNERDDARVTRAFERGDAKQSTPTQAWRRCPTRPRCATPGSRVRAPQQHEAIEQASRMAVAMQAAF